MVFLNQWVRDNGCLGYCWQSNQ